MWEVDGAATRVNCHPSSVRMTPAISDKLRTQTFWKLAVGWNAVGLDTRVLPHAALRPGLRKLPMSSSLSPSLSHSAQSRPETPFGDGGNRETDRRCERSAAHVEVAESGALED